MTLTDPAGRDAGPPATTGAGPCSGVPPCAPVGGPAVRLDSGRGRRVLLAVVLGSGMAFLDGTVVNAALPAVSDDLDTGVAGLQWVLSGYLLPLGALLVVGGSLGDLYGRRRVFAAGLVAFAAASLLCALAPGTGTLVGARILQGGGAALLVPGSLAIIASSFHPDDHGRAIGAWSGLTGVAAAAGPFVGGWLIDAVSWRAVFLINLPIAAVAFLVTARHVPETRDTSGPARLDLVGAGLLSAGLAGLVYALIEGPAGDLTGAEAAAGLAGAGALVAFVVHGLRAERPMVPPEMFRSRRFRGANVLTFLLYGAFGVATFLLVVHLQEELGYSPLEAGAALIPVTVLMLAFSPRAGALAQRIGPAVPLTVGPLLVAAGLALLAPLEAGDGFVAAVLPGTLALGAGLTVSVAPLTTTVLASVDARHVGVGSAVNNAVARIASLLAIAVVPAAAGIATGGTSAGVADGFAAAMLVAAGLAAAAGAVGLATLRGPLPGGGAPPGP